jgi:hypothetical protein
MISNHTKKCSLFLSSNSCIINYNFVQHIMYFIPHIYVAKHFWKFENLKHTLNFQSFKVLHFQKYECFFNVSNRLISFDIFLLLLYESFGSSCWSPNKKNKNVLRLINHKQGVGITCFGENNLDHGAKNLSPQVHYPIKIEFQIRKYTHNQSRPLIFNICKWCTIGQ